MALPTSALDLSKKEDVLSYILDTPFASHDIETLSGGTANHMFRLHLKEPFKDHPTVVLKHGKSMLGETRSFFFDLKRQASLSFF
jgi:hypothetical protein